MSSSEAQHRSGKRKRPHDNGGNGTVSSAASSSLNAAVGLFARSPSERLQLSLAGLSDTDQDPTSGTTKFQHRPLTGEDWNVDLDYAPHDDFEEQSQSLEDKREKREANVGAAPGKPLDILLRSVHQLLDQGNIVRAERVFSLILQQRPGWRTVDMRKWNIWALGAEILMRSGEGPREWRHRHSSRVSPTDDDQARDIGDFSIAPFGFSSSAKWGSSSNIRKVKVYFESLIQQYPYDHRYPDNIAAPDFQIAMLSCEIYHVYHDYTAALSQTDEESEQQQARLVWRRPSDTTHGSEGSEEPNDGAPQAASTIRRETLRLQALDLMQGISRQMDDLLETPIYKKNNRFLRLRVTSSLFIADLFAPRAHMSPTEHRRAENAQSLHRRVAIDALDLIVQNGGELDSSTQLMLNAWSE